MNFTPRPLHRALARAGGARVALRPVGASDRHSRHELPPDAGEDSFSLLPLFRDPANSVREHAVSHSLRGLPALRRGSWKMIFGKGSGGWGEGGYEHPPH